MGEKGMERGGDNNRRKGRVAKWEFEGGEAMERTRVNLATVGNWEEAKRGKWQNIHSFTSSSSPLHNRLNGQSK
jgi:hypothetical protein